ncbi:tyrosine-type recombinase/integrase [Rothia koreensis]|uniref:tyrosine-type recombinase/integrase n=1 Tax=Rothia koreensis TaxID=592378 RepID=UPI003FCDDD79
MAHLVDRWHRKDRTRTDRYGKGLRWQVEWLDSTGAKRKKSFQNKDLAEDYLTEVRYEIKRGVYRPPQKTVTVDHMFAEYLTQGSRKQSSNSNIASRYKQGIGPMIGSRFIQSITRKDIQAVVDSWIPRYSIATIQLNYGTLVGMFKLAVDEEYLPKTPCTRVTIPKSVPERIKPLTVQQVTKISGLIGDAPYPEMILFDAATGLRSGELRGLTWDRIDMHHSTATVDRQMTRAGKFGSPKTPASNRVISLGQDTMTMLDDLRSRIGEGEDRLVFHLNGRAPSHETLRYRWAKAREAIPGIGRGWHQLRHFHASQLIHAGFSPVAVAERLGHATANEVLQTYAHMWEGDSEKMAAVGDSILSPTLPTPSNG